ncbi:MAG: hypothetical protein PHY88_02100 [Candidatus Omnitrophica bacterium]|nr:hypothetical protein [Candidatus Omnitrophota bacterium]
MGKKLFFLGFLALLLTGCARMQVTKVEEGNADKAALRFYHSYPYLLVTRNQAGKLEGKTVYLPKMDEGYFFNVKSGLGTVNASFELADGWALTKFGDARDSKIPETINAAVNVATAAGGFVKGKEAVEKSPAPPQVLSSISSPGLYRYFFGKDGFAKGLIAVYTLEEK